MMRPDLPDPSSSWEENAARHRLDSLLPQDSSHVSQVAQALAAHGGGTLSLDLAFDLVLNEVVSLARSACGANGAAIAWARDGEMVCRATTGNAPNLGVRVETASGMVGACLEQREIQLCSDTESDPRVNPEACRELGVRSMLIAPLTDGDTAFGIVEVFSDEPHAFAEREVYALKGLAQRIVEHKREADVGMREAMSRGVQDVFAAGPSPDAATAENLCREQSAGESSSLSAERLERERPVEVPGDRWTSILGILVIVVAIALGLAVGWRESEKRQRTRMSEGVNSARVRSSSSSGQPGTGAGQADTSTLVSSTGDHSAAASTNSSKSLAPGASQHVAPSTALPSGGLVVTENGKVIYRMPADNAGVTLAPKPQVAPSRLAYRVEPEYPEEARAKNIQGPVILDVQVLGDGSVGKVTVVSGDPILADAAVRAVKQWKYRSYLVDGHPVDSETRITVNFTLPSQ